MHFSLLEKINLLGCAQIKICTINNETISCESYIVDNFVRLVFSKILILNQKTRFEPTSFELNSGTFRDHSEVRINVIRSSRSFRVRLPSSTYTTYTTFDNDGTITTGTTFDNDGTINPTFEPSETYRYNEPRIINVEPRRFEIDTSDTTIDNDGTISWNGVLPSAPRTDQIGQLNDLGLPIYFPDPITEQRIINVEEFPNEPIDDLPTFEQV